MITRIVRMTIDPEKVDTFKKHFTDSCSLIQNFKGCTFLQLYHDADHPNMMITLSKWTSVDELNNYRNSGLFKQTWILVKPLFIAKAMA